MVSIISALAACVAIYISRPERKRVAGLAVILILIAGGWAAYQENAQARERREAQKVVYSDLIRETNSFLDFLSDMILHSAGDWIPETEDQFFSPRTAKQLCTELDLRAPAPVVPDQSWLSRVAVIFNEYRLDTQAAIDNHYQVLDSKLLLPLSNFAGSALLEIGVERPKVQKWDSETGIERPPLLCWGLEPLVESSLDDLQLVYEYLHAREEWVGFSPVQDWLRFEPQSRRGASRFSPGDLAEWKRQHPAAPGPAVFGEGNPNKRM